MRFSDIPGNGEVKERLVRAAGEGRVAHAYLFHGEEGSAALPLAMAFAQYLLCADPHDGDACGQCMACQKAESMVHPDIHFSFPGGAVKGLKAKDVRSALFLDQWREIVKKNPYFGLSMWYTHLGMENKQGMIYTAESSEIINKMNLTPYEADRKILILWLPEKLHPSAANPLLKLIEEPPEDTFFLLVSIDPAQVLPTILSRCQRVQVPRTDDESLRSWLGRQYDLGGETLEKMVMMADGNLLRATLMAEEMAGEGVPEKEGRKQKEAEPEVSYFDLFRRWMRLSFAFDVEGLAKWVDEISDLGREKQKLFLRYVLHVLRENLMMNLYGAEVQHVRLTEEELVFSKKFYAFIHPDNLNDISRLLEEAWDHIAGNVYGKLVFMDVSLKLHRLLKK